MTLTTTLQSFQWWCHQIAAAEQRHGWLAACEDAGRYLAPSRQLVAALAGLLRFLNAGPVLEICAGRGELAEALSAAGMAVVATDAEPPLDCPVVGALAAEALARYRPAVVLGCFVPIDSGVDQAVMGFPSVRHYVVLAARIAGQLGSAAMWQNPNWTANRLDEVSRWMLTRHDVRIGDGDTRILQHGEAWLFTRHTDEPLNARCSRDTT